MTRLRPFVVELGKYGCGSSGYQVLDNVSEVFSDFLIFILFFLLGAKITGTSKE
jgi:hypothetical protein